MEQKQNNRFEIGFIGCALFVIFLLIYALTIVLEVYSEEPGLDLLFIRKNPADWNCQDMVDAVNTYPTPRVFGAFVDNTAGVSNDCLNKLFNTHKVSEFRGHLAWTNHLPSTAVKLVPAAMFLESMAMSHPEIIFHPSAICEHRMTSQQSQALNAQLRPYMPHVGQFTDSGLNAKDPTAIPEKHCTSVSPYVSLDGCDATDVDLEGWKNANRNNKSLIWMRAFNCRLQHGSIPPWQRKNCPSRDQFFWAVRVSYPQPACPGPLPKSGQIWKTFAEYYGKGDSRGNKPMLITRTKTSRINVLAADGTPIAWLKYLAPYSTPGFHRYYMGNGSGHTAFQLGQLAEHVGHSECIQISDGKERYFVDAYRRYPSR